MSPAPDSLAVTAAEALDGADVDSHARSLYARISGDSYKGHNRGWLTGIAIGGAFGAALGVGLCALPFVGFGVAATVIPMCTGLVAWVSSEGYSAIGTAAGSRASALAERHARFNDPIHNGDDLSAMNDKLMSDGRGYHYEFPPDRDKGKSFYWKSGLMGALVMGVCGGLLGYTGTAAGLFPAASFLASAGQIATAGAAGSMGFGLTVATVAAALGPIGIAVVAMTVVSALFGLSFGIDRSKFKSIFNHTDSIIQGHIHEPHNGLDVGREQFKNRESDPEILQHRLRRQSEIAHLEQEYERKIFLASSSGRWRGYAGGAVVGAVAGAALGVLAFALLCAPVLATAGLAATGALALAHLPLLGGLVAAFSGVSLLFSAKIFADTGTEAGAEAAARAIDEEFDRTRLLKSKGITPPTPRQSPAQWFSLKTALMAAACGAIVATPLFPFMGAGILALLHIPALAPAVMTSLEVGSTMIVGALAGSFYGLGVSSMAALHNATNKLYDWSNAPRAEPAIAQAHSPVQPVQMPTQAGGVTAEEAARLSERLETSAARPFAQSVSSAQQTPAAAMGA